MNIGGELLVPGAAGYESARRSQMARFDDVRPRAVARCRSVQADATAFAHRAERFLLKHEVLVDASARHC